MNQEQFEIVILDADSILYQIAHLEPSPAKCRKALDERINDIINDIEAQEAYVFIKGKDNFRYNVSVDYKGNRKDTIEPEVKDRIDKLYEYAREFCIESDNAEADDYCGVAAQLAMNEDKSYILAHIDKDLDMIPGWHYNFRKKEFYEITPEQGYINLMKQILTGDATDNIQGIKGMGPKTADKVLAGVALEDMLSRVMDTYKAKCGDQWEHEFSKSANLIYIRMSADDFKPFTVEELLEVLSWKNKTMDTGASSQNDQVTQQDLSTTLSVSQQDNDTSEEKP